MTLIHRCMGPRGGGAKHTHSHTHAVEHTHPHAHTRGNPGSPHFHTSLPQPPLLLPSNGNPAPPSAANLARLAHMTSVNDQTNDHVHVEPMNDQDPFHTTRSPQPSAAPVGNDAHMRS